MVKSSEKTIDVVQLGINIDHVATLRNARGDYDTSYITRAADICMQSGSDFITFHLREDRRHIRDEDVKALKATHFPLNMEMAATEDMLAIALDIQPESCCLVPEKRQELTTERGISFDNNLTSLKQTIHLLQKKGIDVSLFIEPTLEAVRAAKKLGAEAVELHTGALAQAFEYYKKIGNVQSVLLLLHGLELAAQHAHQLGLRVHAGHGLNYETSYLIASLEPICEVSIGHFVLTEALYTGLGYVVQKIKYYIQKGRQQKGTIEKKDMFTHLEELNKNFMTNRQEINV